MSAVTQCPACATSFRVVPDQLRVADGWVRCGRCGEVFVATAQLVAPEAPTPGQPSKAEPAPDFEASTRRAGDQEVCDDAAAGVPAPLVAAPAPVKDSAPAAPVAANLPDLYGPADQRLWLPPAEVAAASAGPPDMVGEAPFLAAQTPAAAPGLRLLQWLLLLVLLLGLVLQVVLDRRHWLAAHWPAARPALQSLCRPLACRIEPLRQLDAVVIESSAFQRLLADRFRVSAMVRNGADWPVATPALELTLTDAQDQVLLRRALFADELDAPATLAPRSELRLVRELVVSEPAQPAEVAGYRLLLFHP